MLSPSAGGRRRPASFAPPMHAREVCDLPRGEDWIYEFLWGGERVRATKRDADVQLLARDGRDLTNRFPGVAAAVAKIHLATVIVDGEILRLEAFSAAASRYLMAAADETAQGFVLLAYDLLCHEGKDVRNFSLLCRRLLLASVVQDTPLVLSPLVDGISAATLAEAARLGFRGVLARRAGSPYRPNSLASDWRKLTFASVPSGSPAWLAPRPPPGDHGPGPGCGDLAPAAS